MEACFNSTELSTLDCSVTAGEDGDEERLDKPGSIATLSRSISSQELGDATSPSISPSDDLESVSLLIGLDLTATFLLFCMIPSSIWTDEDEGASSKNVTGATSSNAVSHNDAWICSTTALWSAVKVSCRSGTDIRQAERTSSIECSATDIRCSIRLSSEESLRSVLLCCLVADLSSKPISSFSPTSNSDSARGMDSMCTARLTSFSITSQTESDTGESSSIRSRFCKMLKRFTPWGLLLTYEREINWKLLKVVVNHLSMIKIKKCTSFESSM